MGFDQFHETVEKCGTTTLGAGLRRAFRESEGGRGHGDCHILGNHVPGVEVLELEYERGSDLLAFGNQQHSLTGSDLLLHDHAWRK